MSLPLTPRRCRATYRFLLAYPPFSGWKMPAPEEVTFIVSNRTDAHGQYQRYNRRFDKHFITVSGAINGHLITVVSSMAHEMIHLRQAVARTETHGVEHNAEFRRIAARVCRYFGFDPKSF